MGALLTVKMPGHASIANRDGRSFKSHWRPEQMQAQGVLNCELIPNGGHSQIWVKSQECQEYTTDKAKLQLCLLYSGTEMKA